MDHSSSKCSESLGTDEDDSDVQFVCEGTSRPVTEFVDLLSDEDNESNASRQVMRKVKPKDYIDYQKDRVDWTLDRLARHVEVEKQCREERNKAFREKVDSQHAHGLQELEFFQGQQETEEAKRCVDFWLKMPGPRPGSLYARGGIRGAGSTTSTAASGPILCPVMNCNRKFDNGHLLLGHLKRFDHSPCDPTIQLHGGASSFYACVICLRRFATLKEYKAHLLMKGDSADGHEKDLAPQVVQCFACPKCFLLFHVRDECLQHMSASNHFVHRFKLKDDKGTATPLPFPAYAKKLLVSLCKEVDFKVQCTACQKPLNSYMELTAHFRIHCRTAGPVAVSEKRIGQVAEIFHVKAYCLECKSLFMSENEVNAHAQQSEHKTKVVTSFEESILVFSHFNENINRPSDPGSVLSLSRLRVPSLKRSIELLDSANMSGSDKKCKRELSFSDSKSCKVIVKQEKTEDGNRTTLKIWVCECGRQFPSESTVEKHVMIANRILYKCAVCEKLSDDSGVIGLHMSRFHGGAHLRNYLFWCQACKTDMPKKDYIMSHVLEFHGGHGYYYEEEVLEDETSSSKFLNKLPEKCKDPDVGSSSSQPPAIGSSRGTWQCRICEDMFESETLVQEHCKSLNNHQFHKYSCERCKKRFHKIETLYRHCQDQHDGNIYLKFFCGLCEDLYFDEEQHFLNHYETYHGVEYVFVISHDEVQDKNEEVSTPVETSPQLACGCRESYNSKTLEKEDTLRCKNNLLKKGILWYRCCLCQVTAQSARDMADHLKDGHAGTQIAKESFVVKCHTCGKYFSDFKSSHQHYHKKHCFLKNPQIEGTFGLKLNPNVFKFTERSTSESVSQQKTAVSQKRKSFTSNREKVPKEEENEEELPDMDFLSTMTHIIFIDLDNWASFFNRLPKELNQGTFIWGFQGGKNNWRKPEKCHVYKYLKKIGCFFLHPRCSDRKDAADFAICLHAGRLDEQLPKHIPFTVLSGDKGFLELELQFKKTQRPAHVLNPHHIDGEMMYALLNSISDTAKDVNDEKGEDLISVLTEGQTETERKNEEVAEGVQEEEELQLILKQSMKEAEQKMEEEKEGVQEEELQLILKQSMKEAEQKMEEEKEACHEDEDDVILISEQIIIQCDQNKETESEDITETEACGLSPQNVTDNEGVLSPEQSTKETQQKTEEEKEDVELQETIMRSLKEMKVGC
ncbi:E3 SUMO-protein ligase ZNF451 isoform X2 [Protopterus annectens]|uniref:E3 SUMO-protein ligase ZNF451 isoform X2 n=1 Tax=Protopterus annectens TaxID=7888 RepID=UPI001CFA941A|nr:E3 SUMO-protein ligase ZNF451 isoform X2 [Protopterus annectens]